MKHLLLPAAFAVVVVVVSLLSVAAGGDVAQAQDIVICPSTPPGAVRCHARVEADANGVPIVAVSPTGLTPTALASAYGFSISSISGAGQTIAIVSANDAATAESDLGAFSSQFGLPPCTTANGCFTKVDQSGGTAYPPADPAWGLETSLDIEWAHALAPAAHILLVEASSSDLSNLLVAEDYAKTHARYVSNSWGGPEASNEVSLDNHFVQPGVSFFASSGDAGLRAGYPSASPNVISVGGTTLNFTNGSFASETGWSNGGGGCSAYETANAAQSSFPGYAQANCGGKRATPDVSLDADPSSGVSVYDSTSFKGKSGWFQAGGTSASSPMWAARAADTGIVIDASTVYGGAVTFRDITSGNNGAQCTVGFDLCSGRGSWIGSAP